MGRPIEPQSTPAPPKAKAAPAPTSAAQNAGKHGADTLESRDSAASDPQNTAFKARLKRLKLSGARFAELIGAAPKTVEGWLQGIARPSGPAVTLLDLIENCAPARERLEALHPRQKTKAAR